MNEQLQCLLQKLDEPAHRYAELDRYYRGTQPLAFLSPEAKTALGNRFGRMASNIPRLAVTALAERLRITGFTGDTELWAEWIRNDLDQISGVAHREALLLGDSFAIVWADQFGRPTVTVESAKQVAVQIDPGTRQITAAVKRWETKTTTEAVLYESDRITRYRANATGVRGLFWWVDVGGPHNPGAFRNSAAANKSVIKAGCHIFGRIWSRRVRDTRCRISTGRVGYIQTVYFASLR